MKIDLLGLEDLDAAVALSTAEGWNQSAVDWSRLIRLEPSGCFAAREGPRLVGTVTTASYARELAWIGMMVVHPDHRRRGIGEALMRSALDHAHGLGIATVKLDATPAGRPLYESLGFAVEAEMERWQGVARPSAGPGPPSPDGLPPAWIALDRAAFGADRSRLLERLVLDCPGWPLIAQSGAGLPEGFALVRHGRVASYIGPVVAPSAGTAEQLIDGMLARLAGDEVCLDLHRGGFLTPELLAERGLTKRRGLLRMSLGPHSEAGTMPSVCASAGAEFG